MEKLFEKYNFSRGYLIILVFFSIFLIFDLLVFFDFVLPPVLPVNTNSSAINLQESKPPPKYLTLSFGAVETGGICNKLFELLSAIGIAEKLGRIPYIHVKSVKVLEEFRNKIIQIFPEMEKEFKIIYSNIKEETVPAFHMKCCFYNNTKVLSNYTADYIKIEGQFFQSFKYFDELRHSIREWLVPNRIIQNEIDDILPIEYRNDYLICVHVRRGDFLKDSYHAPSEAEFSQNALEYIMKKHISHGRIAAAILGDDQEWEKSVFDGMDNIFIMNNTLEQEFAFTKRFCDVVLITAPSSTFGWFMGYLSRNPDTVVYYRDIHTTKDKVGQIEMTENDYYLPHWIKLKEENGEIIEGMR